MEAGFTELQRARLARLLARLLERLLARLLAAKLCRDWDNFCREEAVIFSLRLRGHLLIIVSSRGNNGQDLISTETLSFTRRTCMSWHIKTCFLLATCPRLAVPVSATSRDNVGVTTGDHWWPLTTAPTHCRCSGSAAHQGAALSCAGRHTADSRKGHTFTTTVDEEQPQIKLISGLLMSNTCYMLWSEDTWWECEHTQAPVLVCWRQCCDTGHTLSRAETLSGVREFGWEHRDSGVIILDINEDF